MHMPDGSLAPPATGSLSEPVSLEERVGDALAQQRLALESRDESRAFLRGQTWVHVESWPGGPQLIRGVLSMLGLHARAQRNARDICVRHHDLEIPALPPGLEGFTILQLSDLHVDIAPDFPDAIAGAVAGLEYDICVLTGDYRAETYGSFEGALGGLESLLSAFSTPVFGILGNHDSIRMVPGLEALGIRMLINESVEIEHGNELLHLAGVDDPHYFRTDDVEAVRSAIPEQASAVLLAHSPCVYERAERAGFEAMLCGHTHGGQLCLPGGIAVLSNSRAPRRLCSGPWRYGELAGYTSVGCGVSVVDVRLNCQPEVTLHRLRPRRP